MLALTRDNYFSLEAEQEYMSCSQFQSFMACEAKAMAKIKGFWKDEPTKELLIGSYVHAWNESPEAKESFIAEHPEVFNKNGTLKADFHVAEGMISTLEKDEFAMFALQGEKEVIFTAMMFGVPWKVRYDVYRPEDGRIVDLKTTKSILEYDWMVKNGQNVKASFIERYDYPMRAAVYCEVERLSTGKPDGEWSEFYLVAVSKEDPPDKAVISMKDPERYALTLESISGCMTRIKLIKSGHLYPVRCEKCNYCRATKKLSRVVHYTSI